MIAPETLAALVIASGALVAAVRLLVLRRDWRAGLIAAMMLASGLLLYLTLFPPHLPIAGETLVVATAETPAEVRALPTERLIALPEAPNVAGAERVPDLATALRRHEQVQRIRVLGRGLPQRDRDAAAGLPVDFAPMPSPRGLVRLDPPSDTAAGTIFTVAGEVNGLEGGTAELLDPAGRKVDRRVIGQDGAFAMGGTARAPGLALLTLRLRGRDTKIASDTPVPLRTIAQQPIRALLIGAPSPEVKYLRRWAEDSEIELQSRLDAGGGVNLAGERVVLDTATLRLIDVVIIDDRSLQTLGSGSRAVLANAVAGGLGLVVRMTAPANAAMRESWRSLGLTVDGGSDIAPVSLSPLAPDAETLAFRRGPGSADVPIELNTLDDPVADLGRWTVRTGPGFVSSVTDADGGVVSGWQQRRQGRVALWTVANSFALVLNGQADRYYQWWSDTVSAVSRPEGNFRPDLPSLPQVGERMAICGLNASAQMIAPEAAKVELIIDPRSGSQGCAAYWPSTAGEHRIVQQGRQSNQEFAFLVLPQAALKASQAKEIGEATRRWAAQQNARAARETPQRRGPAWPYFLAWLLLSGALWFCERRALRGASAG